MYEKSKVLIVQWTKLPKKIQDIVADRERFQNDCYLEHFSEFEPKDYIEGMKSVEDYWNDQKENNEYMEEKSKKSLQDFIEDYGLEMDVWFIEQNINWSDVDKILIEVCW